MCFTLIKCLKWASFGFLYFRVICHRFILVVILWESICFLLWDLVCSYGYCCQYVDYCDFEYWHYGSGVVMMSREYKFSIHQGEQEKRENVRESRD